MLFQLPLIATMRSLRVVKHTKIIIFSFNIFKKGKTLGNIIYWGGIVFGIPWIGTLYYRDDAIKDYFMNDI